MWTSNKFIKLTLHSGNPVWINKEFISAFRRSVPDKYDRSLPDVTYVYVVGDLTEKELCSYAVKETPEQILSIMDQEG